MNNQVTLSSFAAFLGFTLLLLTPIISYSRSSIAVGLKEGTIWTLLVNAVPVLNLLTVLSNRYEYLSYN